MILCMGTIYKQIRHTIVVSDKNCYRLWKNTYQKGVLTHGKHQQ